MSDIQFTDPLLTKEDHIALGMDMGDSHNHHINEQQIKAEFWNFHLNYHFHLHHHQVIICFGVRLGPSLDEVTDDEDDDDVEIDAFYASLGVASIPMISHSHEKLVIATLSNEETRKAFRYVQDFLSNDASILLYPELCSILKANLDYLSKLSADNGSISTEMSKVISEASQFLTHWSRDYSEARTKIDSIMSQLQRADELEMSLESNKRRFLEVVASEIEKLTAAFGLCFHFLFSFLIFSVF
ncbi:hypothetical protein PIB30_031729 [Stylosanthes scabra]|uniref:Uncharacterized protein n=1 Tax=Stylosanthes scabra TaxID=79078 RepID=A0ABU6TBM1_9FABA|nr:hypothetical protein [Stylosanthes scabra]